MTFLVIGALRVNIVCAFSEDSGKRGHLPNLTNVYTVSSMDK